MTVSEAIVDAGVRLDDAGVMEPRREATSLMAFVLDKSPSFLFAHPEYVLSDGEFETYLSMVERRAAREPFHYITGGKEFYGLYFDLGPGILIPRPETEILVEDAIKTIGSASDPEILEIGVGSGCISVSILANTQACAVGVDVSETALAVSAANSRRHGVANRLELVRSDLFENVSGKFDLIVSNPPYVPESDRESLQAEVRDYEPSIALFGGPDGLSIVRRIVADAPGFLRSGGTIMIEIGDGQSAAVASLFAPSVWKNVSFLLDLQGIARIAKASLAD